MSRLCLKNDAAYNTPNYYRSMKYGCMGAYNGNQNTCVNSGGQSPALYGAYSGSSTKYESTSTSTYKQYPECSIAQLMNNVIYHAEHGKGRYK